MGSSTPARKPLLEIVKKTGGYQRPYDVLDCDNKNLFYAELMLYVFLEPLTEKYYLQEAQS